MIYGCAPSYFRSVHWNYYLTAVVTSTICCFHQYAVYHLYYCQKKCTLKVNTILYICISLVTQIAVDILVRGVAGRESGPESLYCWHQFQ